MTPRGGRFSRPALHEEAENRCQTPDVSVTWLTRAFRHRRTLCQSHEKQSGSERMVWSLGRGRKSKFKPLFVRGRTLDSFRPHTLDLQRWSIGSVGFLVLSTLRLLVDLLSSTHGITVIGFPLISGQ